MIKAKFKVILSHLSYLSNASFDSKYWFDEMKAKHPRKEVLVCYQLR